MYYEINVSLNGRHFFATAERSITDIHKAKEVYALFTKHFPEDEGYKITVTRWEKVGRPVNMEEA